MDSSKPMPGEFVEEQHAKDTYHHKYSKIDLIFAFYLKTWAFCLQMPVLSPIYN
jgi:hypothetical protein